MKRILAGFGIAAVLALTALVVIGPWQATEAVKRFFYDDSEPDIPGFVKGRLDKENFKRSRAEYIALRRGLDKEHPVDPKTRQEAVEEMERQEARRLELPDSAEREVLLAPWTPIGPFPIPNGQIPLGDSTPVSGRVSAIAVHPTDPNIVYVGTPAGGLYRSLNGGVNWTQIFDAQQSLAIGAIAIARSQPDIVYVGTGEAHFGDLSFFGVGVYRIENASSPTPLVKGPFAKPSFGVGDVFSGRSISKILVNPANPAIIYVSSQTGSGGIGGGQSTLAGVLPQMGVYRSFNATADEPVFQLFGPRSPELPLTQPGVHDMAADPLDFNKLVINAIDTTGIYYSPNAMDPFNQFTAPIFLSSQGQFNAPTVTVGDVMTEFAVQHTSGPNATFYAATGNGGGRVLRSTNGGQNWTQVVNNQFCAPQCFYDIAIGVDASNASNVFLGGSPSMVFARSTNGATSFTKSEIGLHVDSHVIAVAPSTPQVIYFGSDGGIYKSVDQGSSWINLNNSQFSATQFIGIATHPTDPNFMLGGTQDNGTNLFRANQTWFRADFGDGGNAVIDKNAADTTNVRMYHTYFNNNSLTGYGTVSTTAQASDGQWTFRGCDDNTGIGNGIFCTNIVNFYAPLEAGPGNPNTIYFGSDRLYRSANNGLDNVVVSQAPITMNVPISSIGISPQNDNVRIVGQNNGGLWGTTNGSTTLTNLDPSNTIPNRFVSRTVIDPSNANIAYVTLSAFAVDNVWRTSNLNAPTPTWTPVNSGLPAVPVSAFVVDPAAPTTLYAGTDIGVYVSSNSGGSWTPLGTGLPRIPVFDMDVSANGFLRIATHGRGIWETPIGNAPRISISDVSLNEGLTGNTSFVFNVTMSQPSNQTVTVGYSTSNGTATAGSDYQSASGTITFNPNETAKTVTVFVSGDSSIEQNETFFVGLSNAVNAQIADNQGLGTIVNDDSALSITDVSLNEGNSGTTAFNFTVNLTPPNPQAVTVNYATSNNTATAPSDYIAVPQTLLVFGAGEASKQVTVLVNGDTVSEPNETFSVTLSNPSNSVISDNVGVGQIINDDAGATPSPTPPTTPTPTPPPTPAASPTPGVTPTPTGLNLITDGGFEGSVTAGAITNPNWPSTSTNFITSLCSVAVCGTNGGSAPRTGTYYLWFGGTDDPEVGTASQTLMIPSGSNPVLKYWLRVNSVSAPFNSKMEVKVDGTVIQTVNEPSLAESAYSERSVVVPGGFANGASHTISFEYNNPAGSGTSNFTVDDVSLEASAANPTPTPAVSPTPTPTPGCGTTTVAYSGAPVAIPDNVAAGTNISMPVTGVPANVTDVDFRFDGTADPNPAATGVGVNHSWVGDLKFTLTSPSGTSVTFFDRPQFPLISAGCNSNNLAALTLDDDGGGMPVEGQCGVNTDAAFPSGTVTPNSPLAAFDGQNANGTWTLNVSDNAGQDTGSVRRFSLVFSTPCASTATVTGRVFTPNGIAVRNAAVGLTDTAGVRRTATTSSFGVYSFTNVITGQQYVLGVTSKRYRFTPLTLNISGNMSDVDMTGLE